MDWQGISAIGSITGAISTFLAAIIALYFGLKSNKTKVFARGIFTEDESFPAIENHPNCYMFECVCTGNSSVYLAYIIEKAHFTLTLQGLLGFFQSAISKRSVSFLGTSLPDIKIRKYWKVYPIKNIIELQPGKMVQICIPFINIQSAQIEREELGIFRANKPLTFYIVDMSGKYHRVISAAAPQSFIEEKTCHLVKVSSLTGDPIKQ